MSLFDALLLDPAPFHVWISVRADKQKGSGTVSDPWNGGVDLQGVSQFDAIMKDVQNIANVVVHLGPGEFLTTGYYDGISGTNRWEAQTGMKILGSGVDNLL